MDLDNNNNNNSASSGDCEMLSSSPILPILSAETGTETPKRSTSKVRLPRAESVQRKAEREAKRAEEKRLKEELRAKKAEELQQEKARKAEELQQEKNRKAEERARKLEELQQEKARKLEELQQEKARKLEELQQEKARKAEELQQEKARKAEEKARKEAEYANKRAEQMKKIEQKQAAVQKQEMANKQMANIMDKYVKRIEKPSHKDIQTTTNNNNVKQRCTDTFDQLVSAQDVNFVSDIVEDIKSMKKNEIEINSRPRLNSDSSSCHIITTTTNNPYLLKTRYIHFPEKYFNRPPYYGTFKKAINININPLEPDLSIENIDYTVDSEGEWEEPCKDGEELRSDADDLSDSETVDSDSDADSFIVPHGHLSDDELNEDEQQQSTSTKQAREAAKSHIWDKKVARLNQQRDLKPKFGCIYDPILDEKIKFELSNYLHQFQKILVPKEIIQRDDKEQEVTDETIPKEEKPKKVTKRKSLTSKKGVPNDQQQTTILLTPTAKRTSSVSITVEGASPSKRRKVNSNENCSVIDDTDVIMTDIESMNTNKINVLEDASNVTDIKSSPLTIISNDDVKPDNPPTYTLLIPKRKQPTI